MQSIDIDIPLLTGRHRMKERVDELCVDEQVRVVIIVKDCWLALQVQFDTVQGIGLQTQNLQRILVRGDQTRQSLEYEGDFFL